MSCFIADRYGFMQHRSCNMGKAVPAGYYAKRRSGRLQVPGNRGSRVVYRSDCRVGKNAQHIVSIMTIHDRVGRSSMITMLAFHGVSHGTFPTLQHPNIL